MSHERASQQQLSQMSDQMQQTQVSVVLRVITQSDY
jgi:hypothetical protein